MKVYVNGAVIPAEEATVSVWDHGFLYGMGLFETVRVYQGRLFLWPQHYARLAAGLMALRIRAVWSAEELAEAVLATVAANELQDAYVRLSITGGPEGVGLTGTGYERPSLFIFAKPVVPLSEPPTPKRLQTLSIPRQTPEGQVRFKSHNFLNNALGKLEAGPDPSVEGLFLTREGYLCEGVVSNLFWVRDGKLFTPSPETGLLDGVTRRFVLELAAAEQIACEEGLYGLEELLAADEAFVTNSVQEIVPAAEVDGVRLPLTDGPVTRRLRLAYRRAVELCG